jgi:hypothetical protein
MVAVVGTYQNGYVNLAKEYKTENPVKVIITFLEEVQLQSEEGLSLAHCSFIKNQQNIEHYIGSFSDPVIEERRSEI